MKSIEKVRRYIVYPDLTAGGGIKIEKDTYFETQTENGKVKQRFENGILYTDMTKEYTMSYKDETIEIKEHITKEEKFPVGAIIIWNEKEGYFLPKYLVCEPQQAIADLELLKLKEE